jgi:hypothetical protein
MNARGWSCRRCRRLLPEWIAGDLSDSERAAVAAHLEGCPRCAAEVAELQGTLALLASAPPAPPPVSFDLLWTRLAAELDATDRILGREVDRKGSRAARRFWGPALAAAAVALFALGLLAGRLSWRPAPAPVANVELEARLLVLEARLDRYLERATPILLALSNRDPLAPPGGVTLDDERDLARELAVEAAALRVEVGRMLRGRAPQLVEDLERIFLQVANLRDNDYAQGMALVRSTLEREAILLGVSLERLRGDESRRRPQV